MATEQSARSSTWPRPDWLPEAQWPFSLRAVDLASGPVHYTDVGAGPVLLFVHAGMWSFIWRDVIRDLSRDFRCVALDFPGSGLSRAGPDYQIGLASHAAVLAEFVDRLNLRDITLVLHDLGGPVGLGFATTQPRRVRGLVLAQTFAWWPRQRLLRGMLRVMGARPVRVLNVSTNAIPRATAGRFGVGRRLDASSRAAFLGPTRDRRQRSAFHDLMSDAARSRSWLESVDAALSDELANRPVLTIFGQRNDPMHFQRHWRRIFPTCRQVVVPQGNHFPMNDDPDKFARSLRAWWHESVPAAESIEPRQGAAVGSPRPSRANQGETP